MVPGPRIDSWYRTCHAIDSSAGLVTTTLNGEVLEVDRSVGDLKDNRPGSLEERIVIGKWNRTSKGVDEQFPWSVTNLQLFHWRAATNLSALSGVDCAKPGDYLAWPAMEWAPSGDHVEEYELPEEEVCRPRREERYDLAISLEQTQPRSLATCQDVGKCCHPAIGWRGTKYFARHNFGEVIFRLVLFYLQCVPKGFPYTGVIYICLISLFFLYL